jgi:PKHD-type hydroxylase
VRVRRGSGFRIRPDRSMTVFLEAPGGYDGGGLTVETRFGGGELR